MNYHIIIQDKFFESYIEDIYQIHQEDKNVIWVRGQEGESLAFHTEHPVEYLGNDALSCQEYLQRIKPNDKLFVCWYDTYIGNLILKAGVQAPVYVYLMGGDFYNDPPWWHVKWLLDPLTKHKIIKERLLPVYLPIRKPWRWNRWIRFKKELHRQYKEKLETIKRIDYIVLPEHATAEMMLVNKLYPGCNAKHKVGLFDQNFDLAKEQPMKPIPSKMEPIKILLGNSSDYTGNQFDAIQYLNESIQIPFEVYCMLSYGDLDVRKWICEFGEKKMGGIFHPITSFIDKQHYIELLNEMDVVVTYHNRQQAVGTLMSALALGKPIFIKKHSPVYCQLKSLGVKSVFSVSDLSFVDFRDLILKSQSKRGDTLERLANEYSLDNRLRYLKKLLD